MRRRTSRGLIVVLACTIAVGVISYTRTHGVGAATSGSKPLSPAHRDATATKPGPVLLAAASDAPAAGKPAFASPIVTQTPTTKPAAAPPKPAATAQPGEARTAAALTGGSPLAQGKARLAAGDLLGGRKLLNDALLGGQLAPADADAAKAAIAEANKTLIFAPRRFADDPWATGYTVQSGEILQKIAGRNALTAGFLCRINGIPDPKRLRAGATIKIVQGPFHAVVTKHAFTIDLYLGSPGERGALYVTSYPVGLGKDDSTPTGSWIVEQRVPNPKYYSPRGEGTIEAGDPKNPLGKYWIALAGIDGNAVGKQSYGIHGTIDPDSIGKQASLGCIRLRNDDVTVLFDLLVEGKSTVVVKD